MTCLLSKNEDILYIIYFLYNWFYLIFYIKKKIWLTVVLLLLAIVKHYITTGKQRSRVNYNGTILYQQHCIKYDLTFLTELTNLCIDIRYTKNPNLTYWASHKNRPIL